MKSVPYSLLLMVLCFCGGCCAESEGNKEEVYKKFNEANFDLEKIKLLRNLFTADIATDLFLKVDNKYPEVKRYLILVMQEEKQKQGKDKPVIDYAKEKEEEKKAYRLKKEKEEEEQRKILEQEKIKKEAERKAKEEQEYKEKAQKQKEDATKKRLEEQERIRLEKEQNKKDAEIESAISGKVVTFNPNIKPYTTYQEALSEVGSKSPFNKASITKTDVDAWADVLASIKGYIKNESTKDRGFLKNISSKNKALFDKAQKQIMLATAFLFPVKQGKLANEEQQLKIKAILENLKKLQIELKPVTTGLLKDFEVTQDIKNLLIKVTDELEKSANNLLIK